jgi:hypothetical protein
MIRGKLICDESNHGQEFKDWVRFGVEEWFKDNPQELGLDAYYIVNVKKSRKQGYNCTVEIVGRKNLWTARYYDEDAYRAVSRCLTDLFPLSENFGDVREEAWA